MNRPELYQRTCDILYQAYFDDTLKNGDPCGCAIGNLIAANCGLKIKKQQFNDNLCWVNNKNEIVYISWFSALQTFTEYHNDYNNWVSNAELSGYSLEEVIKIEEAFENGVESGFRFFLNSDLDKRMYNSLVAVLEKIKQIHEIEEDSQIDRFTSLYNEKCLA